MHIKLFRTFILLCCVWLAAPAVAQPAISEQVKRKVQETVSQLNDYISFMADPQKEREVRQYHKKQALNLFIGKGDAYEEDGDRKDGVFMEVSSVNRRRPSRQLMRIYFNGLMNLMYQRVEISATKVYEIQVSDLKRIRDNEYVCTCDYEQTFRGFREGRLVYGDKTRKRVKCYITIEDTEDGLEYKIRLGDTTALETRRITY